MIYKVFYKHSNHKKPYASCFKSDRGNPEPYHKCNIKDCVETKEITYCYECSEYPCALIKNL